jgi:hypothetical protein
VIAAWSASVIVTVSVVLSRPAEPKRTHTSRVSHKFDREGAEELISWTCGERIRFLWYRLCLTVQEMAYTTGQMTAFQMGLTPPDSAPCQERR